MPEPDYFRDYNAEEGYNGAPEYETNWMVPGPYVRGPYTGRGPRGYQRSDERLRDEVVQKLTRHGGLDARGIDVQVDQGEVTLTGEVDNRPAKRLAEDLAASVPGVVDVHNRLNILGLEGRQQWALASAKAKEGQDGIDWRPQVHLGMSVIGAHGHHVGEVKGIRQDDFLVNRPHARDVYVPFNFIENMTGNQILLRIPADVIDNMDWPNPPVVGAPPPLTGTFRETH